MISAIQTALSGLMAASRKVEASASNIANMSTAGSIDENGKKPYTPIYAEQTTTESGAVKSTFKPYDPAFVPAYDPDSPFANKDGIIGTPNVDLAKESVNMTEAKIAYKASAAVIRASDEMNDALLNIFDKKA